MRHSGAVASISEVIDLGQLFSVKSVPWRTLLMTKPYPPSTPAASRPTCRSHDAVLKCSSVAEVTSYAVSALIHGGILDLAGDVGRAHITSPSATTGRPGRKPG